MKRLFLAIDLGGTSAKCGIFNQQKQLVEEFSILTKASTKINDDSIIQHLVAEIKTQVKDFNEIVAIGLTVPGKYNQQSQIVEFAPNLKWKDYPIFAVVKQNWDKVPIYIMNDADAAGYYELKANFKNKNLIVYTLGTGVGGAAIKEYRLLFDANTEFGHSNICLSEVNLGCRAESNCLDILSSARAINETINLTVQQNASNPCFHYLKFQSSSNLQLTTKALVDWINQTAMYQNEPKSSIIKRYQIANQIMNDTLSPLATHIIEKAKEFKAETVIIAGGATLIGEPIITTLKQLITVQESNFFDQTELKISTAKNKSGLYGIFNHAFDNCQKTMRLRNYSFKDTNNSANDLEEHHNRSFSM